MRKKHVIRVGIIGAGLMGRELAVASLRWPHLTSSTVAPEIVAVCDTDLPRRQWFLDNIPSIRQSVADYRELLGSSAIDAVYCAVPHYLHESLYVDIIRSGKALLGEKPFGIDQNANAHILKSLSDDSALVRCSSEFPYFPGALALGDYVLSGSVGRIVEAHAGFWHSSDWDPLKPINWKRQNETNGEYGCMGDLGLHVLHLPIRYGWEFSAVHAQLSNIVSERPDPQGRLAPCDTWDNATLHLTASWRGSRFPFTASMKRIAPGHSNTWFLNVVGTEGAVEFSTKNPKELRTLQRGSRHQAWEHADVPYASVYPTITGNIFEFGFSDAILQMWAAFLHEVGGAPPERWGCITPVETAVTHEVFTAALQSQRQGTVVTVGETPSIV